MAKSWDVTFKLHAPFNIIIEGQLKDGELVKLKVTPEMGKVDVEILQSFRFS